MKNIILKMVFISILLAFLIPSFILATTVNGLFTKTGTIIEIPLSSGSIIDQEGNRIPAGYFVIQENISWYQKIFEKLLKILGISNKSKHIFSISANDNNTEFLIKVNDNYEKTSFADLKTGDNIIAQGRYWTTYGTAPPPKNTNLQNHYSAEKIIIIK